MDLKLNNPYKLVMKMNLKKSKKEDSLLVTILNKKICLLKNLLIIKINLRRKKLFRIKLISKLLQKRQLQSINSKLILIA
jgi:hypothetical protein